MVFGTTNKASTSYDIGLSQNSFDFSLNHEQNYKMWHEEQVTILESL